MAQLQQPINISDFNEEDFTFEQASGNEQRLGIQFAGITADHAVNAPLVMRSNVPLPNHGLATAFPGSFFFANSEPQMGNSEIVEIPSPFYPTASASQPAGHRVPILPEADAIGVTEEEVHEVLKTYVSRTCCFGPAQNFHIHDIQVKNAYKYTLLSLYEKREIIWKTEVLANQQIDQASEHLYEYYAEPNPWNFECNPPANITKGKYEVKIPGTSTKIQCAKCQSGQVHCRKCEGSGNRVCSWCDGAGSSLRGGGGRAYTTCGNCNGSSRQRCNTCNGNGHISCAYCKGIGQVYIYRLLNVSWKTEIDQLTNDTTLIPKRKLAKASYINIIQDQSHMVHPLVNFPNAAIELASIQLIRKHAENLNSTERIIKQKQTVDTVHICEITYSWGKRNGPTSRFNIYGDKKLVYFPKYPSECIHSRINDISVALLLLFILSLIFYCSYAFNEN